MNQRGFGILYLFLFGTLCVFGSGCEETKNTNNDGDTDSEVLDVESDPEIGADVFVSADGNMSGDSYRNDAPGEAADDVTLDGDSGASDRTVEEGDIYRIGASRDIIFNLNSYRGLQVVDISDVENPTVLGRLPLTGYPVEMYVSGDRVYMLLNNWQGYWGTRTDVAVDSYSGGLLVSASVADLTNPVELDHALVPGYIMTSRLIGNDEDRAIYIAASNWNENAETVVKSFYLNGDGTLEDKTLLSLGGYVQDIQASPESMTVARYDWSEEGGSTVSVIDVSDPGGSMVEGAEIPVEGFVSSKTNMDLRGKILRIVSGAMWSDTTTNHLQTFDITDIDSPIAVDHETFGDGEQLYATLFLENKAFFVTYFQTDPFHAFEIDDGGNATEKAEYVISGWNDFFKPVLDNTRIIGIGTNDDAGRQMAVSLYDITELSNPNPFIARQEVDASEYSWSEASFDDRAFSVIEDAVSVDAADGTEETGLVLLPFSGYDGDTYEGIYAVQMFTYSASTLTRRGLLSHGTPVRRSFNPDDDLTANLSEQELSLFNTEDPDEPEELGRVALAPSYDDLLVFGDKGVRVRRAADGDYYNYYRTDADAPDKGKFLETVPLSDPEAVNPLATVEVGAGADVVKVGDLAVAISQYWKENTKNPTTLVQVVDFFDPLSPSVVSTFKTDAIVASWGSYGLDYECAMYGYYSGVSSLPVAGAVVFPMYEWQEEKVGVQKECSGFYYDYDYDACSDDSGEDVEACEWSEAYYYCYATNDEPETCTYTVYECVDRDGDGAVECDYSEQRGLTRDQIPDDYPFEDEGCYEHDLYRYWDYQSFYILDLTDPENPVLSDKIEMPKTEEAAGVLARGNSIYINYKIPYDVPNDSKQYVRYYFKEMDLADPSAPFISDGINVPGVVREVVGDVIYTQDAVYRDDTVVSAINRLTLKAGRAVLDARRRFDDREVTSFVTDKEGHAFVVHGPGYNRYWSVDVAVSVDSSTVAEGASTASTTVSESGDTTESDPDMNLLTILDMDDDMSVLSETEIDTWASLHMVKEDKALFSVPGGILLLNLDDLQSPFAQAYFPINGRPFSVFMNGDTVYMPSGPYGIYTFDTDTYNLMEDN